MGNAGCCTVPGGVASIYATAATTSASRSPSFSSEKPVLDLEPSQTFTPPPPPLRPLMPPGSNGAPASEAAAWLSVSSAFGVGGVGSHG